MYFADSPTRQIQKFEFDGVTAGLGQGAPFAGLEVGGVPDGSTVDADGCLWNAQWGGSRVVRSAPTGAIDLELPLPVSQPTCLCFGGVGMNLLFVSTATEGLSRERLRVEPEAGRVLIYQTSYEGIQECRYQPGTSHE
jgi:sugar lactone lactonase YvrE